KVRKPPLKSFMTSRLSRLIYDVAGAGWLVSVAQPIVCGDSEPEPDVSVIRGHAKDFCKHHPTTAEWVIEIAVNSEEYDRGKLPGYASASVKEVWIILPKDEQIEIYREPQENRYLWKRVVSGTETVSPL